MPHVLPTSHARVSVRPLYQVANTIVGKNSAQKFEVPYVLVLRLPSDNVQWVLILVTHETSPER